MAKQPAPNEKFRPVVGQPWDITEPTQSNKEESPSEDYDIQINPKGTSKLRLSNLKLSLVSVLALGATAFILGYKKAPWASVVVCILLAGLAVWFSVEERARTYGTNNKTDRQGSQETARGARHEPERGAEIGRPQTDH